MTTTTRTIHGGGGVSSEAFSSSQREEKERGESVAEFSIGRALHSHEEADEDSTSLSSAEELDSRVRVQRDHHYEPLEGGGIERLRNETVTTRTSFATSKH